jgi:hypothetical protein
MRGLVVLVIVVLLRWGLADAFASYTGFAPDHQRARWAPGWQHRWPGDHGRRAGSGNATSLPSADNRGAGRPRPDGRLLVSVLIISMRADL